MVKSSLKLGDMWHFTESIPEVLPGKVSGTISNLLDIAGFEILSPLSFTQPDRFSLIWLIDSGHVAAHRLPGSKETIIEIFAANRAKYSLFVGGMNHLVW